MQQPCNFLEVLVLLTPPGIGKHLTHSLLTLSVLCCTAFLLERVSSTLEVGRLISQLSSATVFLAILMHSSHNKLLKPIVTPLVLVWDECCHEHGSRTDSKDMRIYHKKDNEKDTTSSLPNADANGPLIEILSGLTLCTLLLLQMNLVYDHLQADTKA